MRIHQASIKGGWNDVGAHTNAAFQAMAVSAGKSANDGWLAFEKFHNAQKENNTELQNDMIALYDKWASSTTTTSVNVINKFENVKNEAIADLIAIGSEAASVAGGITDSFQSIDASIPTGPLNQPRPSASKIHAYETRAWGHARQDTEDAARTYLSGETLTEDQAGKLSGIFSDYYRTMLSDSKVMVRFFKEWDRRASIVEESGIDFGSGGGQDKYLDYLKSGGEPGEKYLSFLGDPWLKMIEGNEPAKESIEDFGDVVGDTLIGVGDTVISQSDRMSDAIVTGADTQTEAVVLGADTQTAAVVAGTDTQTEAVCCFADSAVESYQRVCCEAVRCAEEASKAWGSIGETSDSSQAASDAPSRVPIGIYLPGLPSSATWPPA